MPDTGDDSSLLRLTVAIVAAHVSNNPVPWSGLSELISGVHAALAGAGEAAPADVEARKEPAVPIKKSVHRDFVCLEDGKKLKMLKRHLATSYNLTPDQYREKWGLPSDYPMVAPAYAERRSALAKQSGLGMGGRGPTRKKK